MGYDNSIEYPESGDAFCIEPWRQLHFDSEGRPGPCCNYIGRSLNQNSSLYDYRNSLELSEIKAKLLKGQRIQGCKSCYRHEAENKTSLRQIRNQKFGTNTENVSETHLMLTFGNKCNTACRMCNPTRSNMLARNFRKIIDTNLEDRVSFFKKEVDKTPEGDPWLDGKKIESLKPLIEKIQILEISGGEPFVHPQFLELLKFIDTSANKQQMSLKITTNGTQSSKHLKYLSGFKNCDLSLSIDSIKDHYELTRWPLKWKLVEESLNELFKHKNELDWTFVSVPMNFNLGNICETIQWFIGNGSNNQKRFIFSHLNSKRFYHPSIAPKKLKRDVVSGLEEILNNGAREKEKPVLMGLINEINTKFSDRQFEKYKKEFVNYTNLVDQSRDQNTWDTIGWGPEDIIR